MTEEGSHRSPAVSRVLERLEGVEGSDDTYRAFCPVHQPPSSSLSRTSLSVTSGENGVGIYCHAGCLTVDIVKKLGLELRDLFDQRGPIRGRSSKPKRTTTLRDAIKFLTRNTSGTVSVFEYPTANGQPFLIVLRSDLADGNKTFRQLTHQFGDVFSWAGPKAKRPLYRLPALVTHPVEDHVLIVEGEKCVESLRQLGVLATTPSQGSTSPQKTDWSPLADRPVLISADNDTPGRAFASKVAQLCHAAGAASIKQLELPLEEEGHDVHDYIELLRAKGGTDDDVRAELQRHIDQATEVERLSAEPRADASLEARPFPVSAFPRLCRDMIEAGSIAQSVDEGFWAVPMLPIMAGCIGGSRRVKLKAGWFEPSIVWAALVAPSGMGKSPGMRELMIPLRDRDKVLFERNQEAERQHREECATAKKNRTPPPEPPSLLTAVVDDTTVEALACRLEDNPRGVLLANDELSGWIKSFDKYRRNGDDREKWLRIFDGDSIKIDRKGTSGGKRQMLIPSAVVSVVGTTQPMIAAALLAGDMQAAGLTSRMLVAAPPVRPPVWTEREIPGSVRAGWRKVVESLLDLPHDGSKSSVLSLTPEARELFVAYHDENGLSQWQASESGHGHAASAIAKLRAYASRFALVLALAEAAEHGTASLLSNIGAKPMAAGIEIAGWFQHEAERCYSAWSRMSPSVEAALDQAILAKLRQFGTLTTGEIRNALHRNPTAAEVRASLERLYQSGKIIREPVETTSRGGRPTEAWTCV